MKFGQSIECVPHGLNIILFYAEKNIHGQTFMIKLPQLIF